MEREFLEASIMLREREAAERQRAAEEREAQRQRELEAQRRHAEAQSRAASRLRRLAVVLAVAVIVLAAAVIAAVLAVRELNDERQRAVQLACQIVGHSPDRAKWRQWVVDFPYHNCVDLPVHPSVHTQD
jgi:hypothetical protein